MAAEGEAEISDKSRYERIRDLLGDAAVTPVAGLHIHVGMSDPETAIRVFNGLRRHLPLLQALAANSPFRHGRDTGLASAREVTIRAWPRSGVPRAMRDFADFCATARLLSRAADVPDYTWFWWKLRPHPHLGTVEIRALDVQTTPDETAAVAALVHCLARHEAELAAGQPHPPAELVEEGLFRAARFGVLAKLPDDQGRLRPVPELLVDALEAVRGHARELGCAEELEGLGELVAQGGGAARQRSFYEIAGMDALLRELTAVTGGGEDRSGSSRPSP
jgi:carboxylate-amine ligase